MSEVLPIISSANTSSFPPNREMIRLRDMLDGADIEWHDNSDETTCRTQLYDGDDMVYSAIYGQDTFGTIELWTRNARSCKLGPIGLNTAEEAFVLIREEVGE